MNLLRKSDVRLLEIASPFFSFAHLTDTQSVDAFGEDGYGRNEWVVRVLVELRQLSVAGGPAVTTQFERVGCTFEFGLKSETFGVVLIKCRDN